MNNIIIDPNSGSRIFDLRDPPNENGIDLYKPYATIDNKTGRYFTPGNCAYGEYSGSLVDKANLRSFQESFASGHGVWHWVARGSDGYQALVIDRTLGIVCDLTGEGHELATSVQAWVDALETYCLADEDLHSALEQEAKEEAWSDWARKDFVRALEKRFGSDLSDTNEKKVDELMIRVDCEGKGIDWRNEQSDQMWCDVEEIAASTLITREDFDGLKNVDDWRVLLAEARAQTEYHIDLIDNLLKALADLDGTLGKISISQAEGCLFYGQYEQAAKILTGRA